MNTKNIQTFGISCGKVSECHAIIHADVLDGSFEKQLANVMAHKQTLLESDEGRGAVPVFMRFFVSDAANQASALRAAVGDEKCAVSIVEQPPLDGTKVALWLWLQTGVEVAGNSEFSVVRGGEYDQCFLASCKDSTGVTTSKAQMNHIFSDYGRMLAQEGMSVKDNSVRTWIYVQNIDVNYNGIVRARNEYFSRNGLTADTHFIASTGIQGRGENYNDYVSMDAYALKGIPEDKVQYLYAKEYLNPTYEYGVSFERGTCVHLSDRRYVFISGTASIDNKGEVLYIGNVRKQVERACVNVEALLAEAKCGFADVAQMIVYLRDPSDYDAVKAMYDEKFPNVPKVIVLAPVCRPTWLIEMECIAVKKN